MVTISVAELNEITNTLLKARNILHKQESGETLHHNEIVIAHDLVDMMHDRLVNKTFERRKKETIPMERITKLMEYLSCDGMHSEHAEAIDALIMDRLPDMNEWTRKSFIRKCFRAASQTGLNYSYQIANKLAQDAGFAAMVGGHYQSLKWD